MAEDKNGFILYKDLIHTVKKMPIEKAGELFLHILKYVNDENPETDDLLIELTFEPIKQSLKRDLKKYETKVSKNSDAGRLGNLKRWNTDLFEKYEKGEITLIEAEKIADGRKCDKVIAKVADSDSVRDSDSGSGSDSDTDRGIKKEGKVIKKPFQVFTPPILDDVISYFTENGYSRSAAIKAFDYYSAGNWKDSKGNQVKNWKQKMQGVWFKDEHKAPTVNGIRKRSPGLTMY